MKDPLGYQSSPPYQKLKKEEEDTAAESNWPQEVLKGAHTISSFLALISTFDVLGFWQHSQVWRQIFSCPPSFESGH